MYDFVEDRRRNPRVPRASDVFRLKVFHAFEVQVDFQIGGLGILAQLVFHGEAEVWFHPLQHRVEVVRRTSIRGHAARRRPR